MKPGIFVSCLFCQMSFVRRFNDEFKKSPYKCNKNSFNTTTWKKTVVWAKGVNCWFILMASFLPSVQVSQRSFPRHLRSSNHDQVFQYPHPYPRRFLRWHLCPQRPWMLRNTAPYEPWKLLRICWRKHLIKHTKAWITKVTKKALRNKLSYKIFKTVLHYFIYLILLKSPIHCRISSGCGLGRTNQQPWFLSWLLEEPR